jgi:hypothetical protein
MSRNITSDSQVVTIPAALHPATLRYSLALVAVAALTVFAVRLQAQKPIQHAIGERPVPSVVLVTARR